MKRLIISLAAAVAMVSCSSQDELTILTCGIRHESNTFSTITTGPGDFEVLRGEEVLAAVEKTVPVLIRLVKEILERM